MRKSRLYIFLCIITLILFFGVAATCNFCGVPVEVGETSEIEGAEAKEDSADTDADDEEDTDAAQESEETGETSEDEVEDDSQEGEVADDNGGQDQEQHQDDNGDSGLNKEPHTIIISADPAQTGLITHSGAVSTDNVFVGHMGGWKQDAEGYVGFNIEELRVILIDGSIGPLALKISPTAKYNPRDAYGNLNIFEVDFGAGGLTLGARDVPGLGPIFVLPSNTDSINHANESLLGRIFMLLEEGKTRLQFRLIYENYSAYRDSSEQHGITFNASDATLEVTYYEIID